MNSKTHYKLTRDGAPYYVAAWVKTLSPRSRYELCRPMSESAPAAMRAECASIRHPQTTYLPLFEEEPNNIAIAA